MSYQRDELSAPRLTGFPLRSVVGLAENGATAGTLRAQMLGQIGIPAWRRVPIDLPPVPQPVFPEAHRSEGADVDLDALANDKPTPAPFETVADFRRAYREGATSPGEVVERLLTAIDASEHHEPPLRVFIRVDRDGLRSQAEAASARWKDGKPLGPLDGVPVAIKDELDVAGLPTTVGTAFLGQQPADSDATVVARLRAAGALIIGKANMHEIGIGVTGINAHHGPARNPYDPGHVTGGSSSGSAAAVAAGFCPIAVGADGGGSIRTPASFCGVLGLKASFGRVSEHGAAPLCWSLAHVGPIAATAADAALGYAIMAGADPQDPQTLGQPAPHLDNFAQRDMQGLKVGVYQPWFEDADSEVVRICSRALQQLEELGATILPIEIPDLSQLHLAQVVTIASEMLASQSSHLAAGHKHGLDVRLNLALARGLRGADYVQAQRWRNRAMQVFTAALDQVDLIATPTNAVLPPPLRPDALAVGESDLITLNAIMRYVSHANLTGLPAISIPAGLSSSALPVGLQLMARGWHEHLLLRAAAALETLVERPAPSWHTSLLRA